MLPLMKNVKYPAHSVTYIEIMMDIINLDLFPSEIIDDKIYYLPEEKAYNINFEACGIESTLFVANIGSVFWIICA